MIALNVEPRNRHWDQTPVVFDFLVIISMAPYDVRAKTTAFHLFPYNRGVRNFFELGFPCYSFWMKSFTEHTLVRLIELHFRYGLGRRVVRWKQATLD
jgi:hypothetical protein